MGWVDQRTGCSRSPIPRKHSILPPTSVPSLSEALLPFSAVILTGGSSGLGKSFIQLGKKLKPDLLFCNLSRRNPAENTREKHVINLNHFACDLSRAADVERSAGDVMAFLERTVPSGQLLLINNSGVGAFGRFGDLDLQRQLAMIDLNVRAVVHLTGRLLPMLRRRGGAIITIASTVAFQPAAYAATYGACKSFVLHWTLALNEELRGTNVRALAVCPGTTTTEFFRAAGLGNSGVPTSLSMTADEVVNATWRALAKGRAQLVPGWKNKLYTFAGSRLPKPLAARIAAKVMARFRLGHRGKPA